MNEDHVISDKLFDNIRSALQKAENWMAYNTCSYFLEPDDVYFFKDRDSAKEFAQNNFSDRDNYHVIEFYSIADVLQKISYGSIFEKRLSNPDANGLYDRDGNDFTDALIAHWESQQIVNNKKNTIMNDKNYEYLKDNIKYLGFGEKLYPELEKNMKTGVPAFQLSIETEFNKDTVRADLHFKKSDNADMYFFNSYQATVEKENKEQLSQHVYLNRGYGFTMKETYNLLNGRAVNTDLTTKEGQKYNAWVQLDLSDRDANGNHKLKQFHQNYGYDLAATLQKYPLKEMQDEKDRERLMSSLQRGNLQSVTFLKDEKQEKFFIEANPQFKTLNVYDMNMQRVQSQVLAEKYMQQHALNNGKEHSAKAAVKQEPNKNADDSEEGQSTGARKSRRKKQSV